MDVPRIGSDRSRRIRRAFPRRRASTRRWVAVLLIFVIFVFSSGLTWCYLRQSTQQVSETRYPLPTSNYVLKLNGAFTLSSAGALIAISDGLFQRDGVTVHLLPGTDDADVASAVAADEHIIGLASAQGFLKARSDGLPIVAFAASYIVNSVEFFVRFDTKLLGPADMEGLRIGYKTGSDASTILRAFIARNAVSQSGLTITESVTAVSDLVGKNIDVLIGHRDVEGQELENSNTPYRSLSPDSFGVHMMGTVYFANERAFSSPDRLEKFLSGIVAGWNTAYSDQSRTYPIIGAALLNKFTPLQISHFMDGQRRFLRPSGTRFGELDLQRLKDLQDLLLQQRVISRSVDLNLAVNFGILDEVYRARSDTFSRTDPK
jgi:putative hydroxymethylpyrimidine transport system substrate-binding protein